MSSSLLFAPIFGSQTNIVLVAGSAAFKAHKGHFARYSEVFKDMFLVDRAAIGPLRQLASVCDATVNEEGKKWRINVQRWSSTIVRQTSIIYW